MRPMTAAVAALLALALLLTAGCEKTIKDVRSSQPSPQALASSR